MVDLSHRRRCFSNAQTGRSDHPCIKNAVETTRVRKAMDLCHEFTCVQHLLVSRPYMVSCECWALAAEERCPTCTQVRRFCHAQQRLLRRNHRSSGKDACNEALLVG